MPWCDECNRSYNPSSVAPDGTCMTCGKFIADEDTHATASRTPWHFWVLVVALVVYLGWRLVEFLIWLVT